MLCTRLLPVAADSAALKVQAPLKAFLAGPAGHSVHSLPQVAESTCGCRRGNFSVRHAALDWAAGSRWNQVSSPSLAVLRCPVAASAGLLSLWVAECLRERRGEARQGRCAELLGGRERRLW